MGIIDTLTAGFDLVRRKPWLVLLPIALNVAVWLAPRLSLDAFLPGLLDQLARLTSAGADPSMAAEQIQALQQLAPGLNLAWLAQLTAGYLGLPSLPLGVMGSVSGLAQRAIPIAEGNVLAASAGLLVAGLAVGTFFLALIAQEVRLGHADGRQLIGSLPRFCWRLLGAGIFVLVGATALAFPLVLTLSLLAVASPALGGLLALGASIVSFWVMIYLAFVPEAIVLGDAGVLRAIGHSITIVRVNFWSAFALLMLTLLVIPYGLGFIWTRLMASAPGALVSIVANAFVGTGLTAALLIYYRDRLVALQTALEQQRSRV